jgi:hypothetical protein
MKMLPFSHFSKWFAFSLIAATPSLAVCADIVLQKAPPLTVRQAPAYPENLARYHFGADVKAMPQSVPLTKLQLSSYSQDNNTSEAALLCDDPTTGYELPHGPSSLFVSLANIENIESLSFLNRGAVGDYTIAVSNADVPATSPEWRTVGKGKMVDGAVSPKVGPGEAKYIKVDFKLTNPGRIASFGVYATPALSDFTMPRPRKVSFAESSSNFALINFNFSDLHARARGLYVSSGESDQVNNMIDDQPATVYNFASGDVAPVAVIDLGRERNVSRMAAIYAQQPGTVDFYVLRSLPGGLPAEQSSMQPISNVSQRVDLPVALKLGEQDLANLKPVGSVVSTGEGHASIDFPAVTGRYIMLKWHPTSMKNEAFSIAQVAAFGPTKASATNPTSEEQAAAVNDGKQVFDGKSTLDGKEALAEGPEALAEGPPAEGPPPSLPPGVPFTFIPEVPPVVTPVSL